MLDFDLDHRQQGLPDFRLLERSTITIAGVKGERIAYSYSGFYFSSEHAPQTGTAYKAYFDSKGLIWKLSLIADEYAAAERAKSDFEHLLETFRILD